MHIWDKLKSLIGLVITLLLAGSIVWNYIESQTPKSPTITYAELVERTASRNAESDSDTSDTQADEASESNDDSVTPNAQTDLTTASQAPVTQSAATTIIPTENLNSAQGSDEANQLTVYVSSTGKYHKKCDCSGMKNCTEMTLQQAIEAGLTACKRCW